MNWSTSMSGARSQAMWAAAVAAGLKVVTGAGLVVAPSLLAKLLFASEMNPSGDLVGRISGLVMVCLALGRRPRRVQGRRPADARAAYRAERARHRLSDLRRHGWGERWRAALAGSRDPPHPYDPTEARLDEPAGSRMTWNGTAKEKAMSDGLKRALIGAGLSVALMLMAGVVAPSMAEDSLHQDFGVIRACGSDVWHPARTCCPTSDE